MINSTGPQANRDRMIWKQNSDVPPIDRDDLVDRRELSTFDNVEGELSRLRRENSSLRDEVKRSLRELKAYQTHYPSPYMTFDNEETSPSWTSSPEVMTPLFIAYDSRIKELEDIISKQTLELDVFREKVGSVLAENEALREAQLEQLRQKKGADELGPVNALSTELLAEMNERVDILMAENALLVEQKTKMSATVEDLRLELSSRTSEVGMLAQRLSADEEHLVGLNQRVGQAERDREDAAGQAIALSEELGNAKTNIDILREQMIVWQTKCADAELALHEARKQLALINNQAEDNNLLNMRRTKAAEDMVRELQQQLAQKADELEAALDLGRKLRREYQSTRQDAEGMLQVMSGLERQVAEYHDREEEVNRLSRESQEKIEEAFAKRDQAIAREEASAKEVQRLVEERATITIQHQAALDATSEAMRQRCSAIKRNCEEEMKLMATKNAGLIADTEKSEREYRSARQLIESMQKVQEEDRLSTESKLHDLEERVQRLVVQLEDEKTRRTQVQEYNKELRDLVDKLRSQMESLREQVLSTQKNRDSEVSSVKSTLRELQRSYAEKARDLARKTKELDELSSSVDSQVSAVERKYNDESALFRKRSADADRVVRELELVRNEGEKQTILVVDEIKRHALSTQHILEDKLKSATDTARSLSIKTRELEHSVNSVSEEKEYLTKGLEEAKVCIFNLQKECDDQRAVVVNLTAQLSSNFENRFKHTDWRSRGFEEKVDYVEAFFSPTRGNRKGASQINSNEGVATNESF